MFNSLLFFIIFLLSIALGVWLVFSFAITMVALFGFFLKVALVAIFIYVAYVLFLRP